MNYMNGSNGATNEEVIPQEGNPSTNENMPPTTMGALKELGQTAVPTGEPDIFCITIIGQIEGHIVMPPQNKTTKYEHIIPQLVAAEQNKNIKGLLIILNTVGGDVEAGLAIAEMISSLSKPTVTVVIGGAIVLAFRSLYPLRIQLLRKVQQ